jgi:hypothetical protein
MVDGVMRVRRKLWTSARVVVVDSRDFGEIPEKRVK